MIRPASDRKTGASSATGGRHLPPFRPAQGAHGTGPDPAADAFLASILARAGQGAPAVRHLLRAAGILDRAGHMRPRDPARSKLNADGSPLQLCLTTPQSCASDASRPMTDARLLLDPFFDWPATRRIRASLVLAAALSDRIGAPLPLDQLGPMAALPGVGAVWLALPLTHQGRALRDPTAAGLAAYLNPGVFGFAPWDDTAERLDRLLPAAPLRAAILDAARPVTTPVCLALEARRGQPMRAKLYLRATGDLSRVLACLPEPQRPHGPLDVLAPQAPWPATGVTLGLSFAPDTGAPDGAKMDLCLCPRCRAAARVPDGVCGRMNAAHPGSADLPDAALALLGFASGGKGARMNAYFAPRSVAGALPC